MSMIDDDERAKWFDKPLEDIRERMRELENMDEHSPLEREEYDALQGYIDHMTRRQA